jgi:uncharacterized phage protein (predicted DNA packaging)
LIVTLDEVKSYLRIEKDYTQEDDDINSLIQAAETYLLNATGKTFDSTNAVAKLFVKVLVVDWYENHEYVGKESEKVRHSIQSILQQLKYC